MYVRKLPSGLWQATVRGPDGKRHTKTDRLKSVVKQWGTDQESALARGEFRDPRLGEIRVAEWHARVVRARGIEDDHEGQERLAVADALRAGMGRLADVRGHPAGGAGVGKPSQGHAPGAAQGEGSRAEATRTCRC